MIHRLLTLTFLAALLSLSAKASSSAVNWLLVYDPASPHAASLASHYQQTRNIPDTNLFAYDFPKLNPGSYTVAQSMTSVQTYAFIEAIRAHLTAQNLSEQIDGIVLVGDTPTVFQNEVASNSFGSLTAALWFAPNATGAASLRSLISSTNPAFRGPANGSSGDLLPTLGIDRQTDFNGQRMWMATHLGFTGAKGLRAEEVMALIDRSAAADGKNVEGTVYWPLNADVRSTTRASQVPLVQAEWEELGLSHVIEGQGQGGVNTQVVQFTNKTGAPYSHPARDRLVQGQIVGRATVPVETARNLYAPGAIAEHLTSFGGRVNALFDASQTAHTDWLRFGASGSSGTVVEPTALWEKFPHARMHSHYFRGANLAEAFLQSVKTPVQLMVSGDPLTRPFADIPSVSITAPTEGATVSGSLQINVSASSARTLDPDMDLAVNGRYLRIGDPAESISVNRNASGFLLDTPTLPDGWHELRVIARNADALRTPGERAVAVVVQNTGASLALSAPATVPYGDPFSITATPTGLASATAIEIRFAGQTLATLPPAGGSVSIDSSRLSHLGPSRLQAVALTSNGEIRSTPITVSAVWQPTPAQSRPVLEDAIAVVRVFSDAHSGGFDWENPADFTGLAEGYGDLSFPNPDALPFLSTASLNQAGIEFISLFYAANEDLYDFAFDGAWTEASLLVNGDDVIAPVDINLGHVAYGAVRLAAGWHELRIRLKPANASMRFRPAVRARDTFFFEQYDFIPLDHTRCFAPADVTLSPLMLAARPQGGGQAAFNWTNPPANATEFRIEGASAPPAVSLTAYRGDKTPPSLEAAGSANALQPGAPVANDTGDVWTSLPPFLRQGARLLTAEADRTLVQTGNLPGTADLYEVQVPAGTTIYGIFHRNTPAASPQWMQAQGDWTPVSVSVQSERWPDWRVWKKAPLAASGTVTLGHGDVPWGGAVSYVFINEPLWSEEGVSAAGTDTLTLGGLPQTEEMHRLTVSLPGGISVHSPALRLDAGQSTANAAPSVFAGTDQRLSLPASAALQGRAADDSDAALTASWSLLSGPGSVIFAESAASFSAPGTYILQLTASDGTLSGSDTLTVEVLADASANLPPIVNAGSDRSTYTAASLQLSGSVSDDGLPLFPGSLTRQWQQLSGPAPVLFSDIRLLNPRVAFPVAGSYVLELSASDGALVGSDSLTVTVTEDPNQPPQVNAGPDSSAQPGQTLALQASVIDDGLPNPPSALSYQWRQLSGPATALFSDPDSLDSNVTFALVAGDYLFELQADDGGRSASDTLHIEVAFSNEGNQAPEVTLAHTEIDSIWLDTVEVLHTVSDDGLPNPPGQLSYVWSVSAGPPGGDLRAETDPDGSRSRLWFTEPGSYELSFAVFDGAATTTRSLTVHVPALATRGLTWYWGQNRSATDFRWGSSGTMETATSLFPTLSARRWKQINGHSGLSIAIDREGNVWTQGADGRLGEADAAARFAFSQVPGLEHIVDAANANTSAAAVDRAGQLFTWGSNSFYQLGLGESSTDAQPAPAAVPGMETVRAVDAGTDFFVALLRDGSVRTWGRKLFDSLGNGATSGNRGVPQDIGLNTVRLVAAGQYFGVALREDGTLRSWGRNNAGQLGNGERDSRGGADQPSPVTVLAPNGIDPFDQVIQIAAGDDFVLALRNDGTVWMWGYNGLGQAGQGNLTDKPLPTQIPGLPAGIVQVAAARRTAYALDADGQVWASGSNEQQLLGLPVNTPSYRASVAVVGGLPPISSLHANYRSVYAISRGFSVTDMLEDAVLEPLGMTSGFLRFRLSGYTAIDGAELELQESRDLRNPHWQPASPAAQEVEDHGDMHIWNLDYAPEAKLFLRFSLQP